MKHTFLKGKGKDGASGQSSKKAEVVLNPLFHTATSSSSSNPKTDHKPTHQQPRSTSPFPSHSSSQVSHSDLHTVMFAEIESLSAPSLEKKKEVDAGIL